MPAHNPLTQVRIHLQIPIDASPATVWTRLTRDVSKWWPITFCADKTRAKSFYWEIQLGGRMYEDWGNGEGFVWWTIFKLDQVNHELRASGNLGAAGLRTEIKFKVTPQGQTSCLDITEILTGPIEDPAETEQGQIDGWNELFRDAFKPWIEKQPA